MDKGIYFTPSPVIASEARQSFLSLAPSPVIANEVRQSPSLSSLINPSIIIFSTNLFLHFIATLYFVNLRHEKCNPFIDDQYAIYL